MKPKNFPERKLKRRLVAQKPLIGRDNLFDLYAEELQRARKIRSKKQRGQAQEASAK